MKIEDFPIWHGLDRAAPAPAAYQYNHTVPYWTIMDWQRMFDGSGLSSTIVWRRIGLKGVLIAEPLTPEDVEEIIDWDVRAFRDYADQDIVAVLRLTNGRWASLEAWSDSSGWGCQDGVEWRIGSSREEAEQLGLSEQGRRRLGIPNKEGVI